MRGLSFFLLPIMFVREHADENLFHSDTGKAFLARLNHIGT